MVSCGRRFGEAGRFRALSFGYGAEQEFGGYSYPRRPSKMTSKPEQDN